MRKVLESVSPEVKDEPKERDINQMSLRSNQPTLPYVLPFQQLVNKHTLVLEVRIVVSPPANP